MCWNNVANHFKVLLDEYESDDTITFIAGHFDTVWADPYIGKRRISPITLSKVITRLQDTSPHYEFVVNVIDLKLSDRIDKLLQSLLKAYFKDLEEPQQVRQEHQEQHPEDRG